LISLNIGVSHLCEAGAGGLRQMNYAPASDLLRQCEQARAAGQDFPTIWNTLLKRHPLVRGMPGHEVRGGEAFVIVRLLNGQTLASSTRGFSLL